MPRVRVLVLLPCAVPYPAGWSSPATWTQTTVPQDLCHAFVAVCDCETERNPWLLFFSLILVCHWRRWSFAGVPIASCARMQQWKMWCSFQQNTVWYVAAAPEPKQFSHSPLCRCGTMPIYSQLGLLVKKYIRSSLFLQSILFIYIF